MISAMAFAYDGAWAEWIRWQLATSPRRQFEHVVQGRPAATITRSPRPIR